MAKNNKKVVQKRSKQLIAVAIALVAIMGVSYAWLTIVLNGTKSNQITAGNLRLTLDETSGSSINIDKAVPMSDATALDPNTKLDTYTFTLENTGNIDAEYSIYLDNGSIDGRAEMIQNNHLHYNLQQTNGTAKTEALTGTVLDDAAAAALDPNYKNTSNKRMLAHGTISPGSANKITFTLRLWIAETATTSDLSDQKGVCSDTSYTSQGDCENNSGTWSITTVPREFAGTIRVDASQTGIPSGTNVDYTNGQTITSNP